MSYDDDARDRVPPRRRRYYEPEDEYDGDDYHARSVDWPHSGMGIASFLLGLLAVIGVLGMFVLIVTMENRRFLGRQDDLEAMTGLAACGSGLGALVGLGLGIGGVCQSRRRKVFGVIGLCLNGILLLGLGVLILIGVAVGMR
jgi:hypothetical protein